MKRHLNLILLIFIWILGTTTAFGSGPEDIITTVPNGSINWTRATVRATGIGELSNGRADDQKARQQFDITAKNSAGNNLLQILSGILINSKTTVGDIFKLTPAVKAEVVQMVSSLEPIETVKTPSDKTFEVTLQFELRGKFSRLVLPAEIKKIKPIKPITPTSKATSIKVGNTNPSNQHSQSKAIIHTGMIVNAKGLKNIRPAMVPTIVDESGQEIFGPAFVSREFAVLTGISGYSNNLTSAQNNPRVRYHPLIVKGLRTDSNDSSVIVVSNSDAAKLRAASENLSFLRKCRVIIVLD